MATDADDRTEKSIRAKQTARIVVVVVVVGLLALWAIANDNEVEVDWLIETTNAPLVVVILASAAAGFIIGLLSGWRRR